MRCRLKRSRVHVVLFFCSVFLRCFPVFISAAVVTLDSIEIFNTHELIKFEPSVYFKCKGENKTHLPDVKKKHVLYAFRGEESWQPLTSLTDKKCKRCGFYEDDIIKFDHVFDEWEFCASDFTKSDGKYIHFLDKEFNATFLCPDCIHLGNASEHSSASHSGKKRLHWMLVILISILVSIVLVFGAVIAHKYWQKRKRRQEQARFLKLFDDGDDIEDELGIGPLSHVI